MSKRFLIIISIILLWECVLAFRYVIATEEVSAGSESVQGKEMWNSLIAEYVNENDLKFLLGGERVLFREGKVYMDEQLEFMIPINMFRDNFQCAVNVYNGENVLIERGNTRIELTVGSSEYRLNNSILQLSTPIALVNDLVYIPLSVVKTALGYTDSWNIMETTLSLGAKEEVTNILPSYYNYTEMGKTTVAKDQGSNGICWAFAALTALETSLMPEENMDFSEDHLALRPSYAKANGNGGDYTMALAYLLSWEGPVYEAQDPYNDNIRNDSAETVKHVQEAQIITSKDFAEIKRMIYQYGGVQSSLYMSLSSAEENSYYYNSEKSSYAYIGTERPNHDVVIIGWDDTYPKENFNVDVGGDGAFICRNSWGSEFGDEGNFYISYYDTNIGVHNIVYTKVEDKDNYDAIYQSDLCGWTGNMGYNAESAYMANIYTAQKNQKLSAVGFYATDAYTEYTVYVVKNYRNTGDLERRMRVASGSFGNAGYYTVPIDMNISVAEGESFAVVVQIKTPNATMPIAIEYQTEKSNLLIDVSDGTGYISSNGRYWESTENDRNVNVCLKAYMTNES